MSETSIRLQNLDAYPPSAIGWRLNSMAQGSLFSVDQLGAPFGDFASRYGASIKSATAQVEAEVVEHKQGLAGHYLIEEMVRNVDGRGVETWLPTLMGRLTIRPNQLVRVKLPSPTEERRSKKSTFVALPQATHALEAATRIDKDEGGRALIGAMQQALGRLAIEQGSRRYAYIPVPANQVARVGFALEAIGLRRVTTVGSIAVGASVNQSRWPIDVPSVLYANTKTSDLAELQQPSRRK